MTTRHDPTIVRTNAAMFEAPALIPIGDAKNVVLGIPWNGDDYIGFTPPQFEFQADDDEGDAPSKRCSGEARHNTTQGAGVPRMAGAKGVDD